MVEEGPEERPDEERLRQSADVHKDAWEQTIADMHALAEEREENGWKAVTVIAGDTGTEGPDEGVEGRYGLVFVVPGNKEEPFTEAFEQGTFPKYNVYRNELEGRVFLVVELLDPETETVILLAGNFLQMDAFGAVRAAKRDEKMYTHVQKLDATHLGSFEHDGYEKFFPDADRILQDYDAAVE
ncbi:hypothetical protein ACFQH6_00315 [Halobacteriaceae archaeon GCM10025711]